MEDQGSHISIRRASSADLPIVCEIWRHGVPNAFGVEAPAPEIAESFFEERISGQTGRFGIWVAEKDGAIVGWQGLQPCRANPISLMAEASIYVSCNFQRRGIGRQLVSYAAEHASISGLRQIFAYMRTDNVPMVGIFESLGWSLIGRLPRGSEDEPECLLYALATLCTLPSVSAGN
jgi:L-amino acid N-acyltransferase YncA